MTAWSLPPVSGRARLCDTAAVAKPEQARIRNSEPGWRALDLPWLGAGIAALHVPDCRYGRRRQ